MLGFAQLSRIPRPRLGSTVIASVELMLACGVAAAAPDLIVGDLNGVSKLASDAGASSYSFGATTCNIGDEAAEVIFSSNHHPILASNLYRLENGRFEQLGMSWLFHEFCALAGSICATCTPGPACNQLGAGCSTSDTATLMGQQINLGPRSDVNPSSGVFLFPATNPPFTGGLARRLQVANADLDPALHPGATYFAEIQVVSSQDSAAGNDLNNFSHRRVNVGPLVSGGFVLAYSGLTVRQEAALQKWQAADPGVMISTVDVTDDGRYMLASRASINLDGTWHYEYALLNVNSQRAGASFTVPLPAGVAVSNVGFHDVSYHSGETIDGTDWASAVAAEAITWSTQTFDVNPSANALRWSTLYNFRFDAPAPPGTVSASLGLFQSGTPAAVTIPMTGPVPPPAADLSGDGHVNGVDLAMLLVQWGRCPICVTDPCPCAGDLDHSGSVTGLDLAALLAAWTG